ncbi:MAG: hypothetical protein CMD02_03495 [Flavobacteriales bacterium]|nr:hypothetical protein [Flavobacteriales bacterium]
MNETHSTNVEIKIYNMQGELVDVVLEENKLKVNHFLYFNEDNSKMGTYLCSFKTETLKETKRFVVMR